MVGRISGVGFCLIMLIFLQMLRFRLSPTPRCVIGPISISDMTFV
jgi:hypothetical protein